MRRPLVMLLAVACVAACDTGNPIAEGEVSLRVIPGSSDVELGKSFPLTVVRVWSTDLEPTPWNDRALLPLVVRPDQVTRREDGRHVEETRVLRAFAFEPGLVTVKPPSFEASPRSGGPSRVATCDGFTIRVTTALDPKTAGAPEILAEIAPEPRRWWLGVAIGVAILTALAHLVRTSRRKAPASAAPDAPAPPDERRRDRLRRLREEPRSPEEVQAWHVEASSIVRDYLVERFSIHACEMTTEDLSASPAAAQAIPAAHRAPLFEVLGACDLVKFGRHPSTPSERDHLLAVTEFLVLDRSPR